MTPKFVKTTVRKSENLGEKLSKKRVSLGYEIRDVERAIRIRSKHIEYIEAGEWNKLPPDVYVRGFLKSYARFLHLDPDKVVAIYLKEKGLSENVKKIATKREEAPKKKFKAPRIIVTPKRMIFIATGLVALAIVGYIGWQVNILTAPPKLSLVTPEDNIKVSDDTIIIEGKTDAGANVFVNSVPIGVSPEGTFKESISLQEGVNLIKISSKNRLEKTTEISRTIVADLAEPVLATKNEDLTMKITVGPEAASLLIKVDGKLLSEKENLMLPGAIQTLTAKDSIVLSATDGSNIKITLNGEDLGVLGKAGQEVKNKEYTAEAVSN